MTQLELAKTGKISEAMRRVAKIERADPDVVRRGVASGKVVIPLNRLHKVARPCAIGQGMATKINANIGTSKDSSNISNEIRKMRLAIEFGADTVMDLSTGPMIAKTRRRILAESTVPVGTVPIYEIAINEIRSGRSVKTIKAEAIFSVLEAQARDGVDFFTIHAGVVRSSIDALKKGGRILDIVSRGGAFLAEWMIENKRENPFYECFDRVIDIAREYDVTLSLGDGLRPGAVADATDNAQISELMILGELQKRAFRKGVQVMIEGPGHVPINQIEANVLMEKTLCGGAPFYVLGPLVTDVAPGYDHITAAIGGALAGSKGADFLCYVTPSEHLRLPTLEDVREGVVASKIAAHAADIAKGKTGALEWDCAISRARRRRDWKEQFSLAIDKNKPKAYRRSSAPGGSDVCTMCSEYCSIKMSDRCLGRKN
jgi:phosphomethylpyrimidine synthase